MAEDIQTENKKNAVEEARELLIKIEAANKEAKLYVERKEQLLAEAVVSGKADAGQSVKPIIKEETPREYKDRVMRGEI